MNRLVTRGRGFRSAYGSIIRGASASLRFVSALLVRPMPLALFLALVCAAHAPVGAFDYVWTGAVSSDWNNADNWEPDVDDGIPNEPTDTALVDDTSQAARLTGHIPLLPGFGGIGALTIRNAGEVYNGDGAFNYQLVVTNVDGESGLTLIEDPDSSLTVYPNINLGLRLNDLVTEDLWITSGGWLRILEGGPLGLQAGRVQVNDELRIRGGNVYSEGRLSAGSTLIEGLGDVDASVTVKETPDPLILSEFVTDDLTINSGGKLSIMGDGTRVVVNGPLVIDSGEIEGAGNLIIGELTTRPTNDGTMRASGGTLTVMNDLISNVAFDIEGTSSNGHLEATSNSTLFFDMEVESVFEGSMRILAGGLIRIEDDVQLWNGGRMELINGKYEGPQFAVARRGELEVKFAGPSRIDATAIAFLTGSTSRLYDQLLLGGNATITPGASFDGAGNGSLVVLAGSQLNLLNAANVGVEVRNAGRLELAGDLAGVATVRKFGQLQTMDATLAIDLGGHGPGQSDQLIVIDAASLDGTLDLERINNFEPTPYDPISILTATVVTGMFDKVVGDVTYADDFGLAVTYEPDPGPDPDRVLVQGACLGDANLDGVVDGRDFNIWNEHKFTSGNSWINADFNGDGDVGGSDFNIWNEHKFTAYVAAINACVPSPAAVPEPSAVVLLLLGVLLEGRIRRRAH